MNDIALSNPGQRHMIIHINLEKCLANVFIYIFLRCALLNMDGWIFEHVKQNLLYISLILRGTVLNSACNGNNFRKAIEDTHNETRSEQKELYRQKWNKNGLII